MRHENAHITVNEAATRSSQILFIFGRRVDRKKPCIFLGRRTERKTLYLLHKQNASAAGASGGDLL